MFIGCIILCHYAVRYGFLFQNNLQNLDPSLKMDLDFCDCFEGELLAVF